MLHNAINSVPAKIHQDHTDAPVDLGSKVIVMEIVQVKSTSISPLKY